MHMISFNAWFLIKHALENHYESFKPYTLHLLEWVLKITMQFRIPQHAASFASLAIARRANEAPVLRATADESLVVSAGKTYK